MIRTALAIAGVVAALSLVERAAADSATFMPSDTPVDVNGYELACTGIGDIGGR